MKRIPYAAYELNTVSSKHRIDSSARQPEKSMNEPLLRSKTKYLVTTVFIVMFNFYSISLFFLFIELTLIQCFDMISYIIQLTNVSLVFVMYVTISETEI